MNEPAADTVMINHFTLNRRARQWIAGLHDRFQGQTAPAAKLAPAGGFKLL